MATTICADGDQFELDEDGRLHLKTGCGLYDGPNGVSVAVSAVGWPYPCTPAAGGGRVYCDSVTGQLVVAPEHTTISGRQANQFDFVPPGTANELVQQVDSFTLTNPSTCRSMIFHINFAHGIYYQSEGDPVFSVDAWQAYDTVNGGPFTYYANTAVPAATYQRNASYDGVVTLAPSAGLEVVVGQRFVGVGAQVISMFSATTWTGHTV